MLVRRPGDAILMPLAVIAFAILTTHAGEVTVIGKNIFELVNNLPDGLNGIFTFFYHFGALWIAAALAGFALVLRRSVLLAATFALSGVTAWLHARLLVAVTDSDQTALPPDLATTGVTSSFPLVRVAMAVSLATAAIPYAIRLVRIIGWIVAGIVGKAALYLAERTAHRHQLERVDRGQPGAGARRHGRGRGRARRRTHGRGHRQQHRGGRRAHAPPDPFLLPPFFGWLAIRDLSHRKYI